MPLFLAQITSFEEEMKCVADRPFVVTQDSYLPTVPMLRDSKYFHQLLLNQRKYKTSLKTEKEKKVRRNKEGERERELEGEDNCTIPSYFLKQPSFFLIVNLEKCLKFTLPSI